ncbi:hypothetical protein TIFTF001_035953 [Ficus carica]|uniref:DUF8039 domain-containing protein n=1 Tax=Ficus carica TaxID=3494 RepID=A0AA88E2I4_FICCA|nr:hypothetical protein TIFTF001_035953 [Ficus carica]
MELNGTPKPPVNLSLTFSLAHAVSLSLLAVAQAARLSLSLLVVAQAVGYVLSYAVAHNVARTHIRVLDHEEECSTQTQVGKPRRTNSPRFNLDEDGKRRATLMRRVHQSCGESAKGFRYDLYQVFVRDHIDEENVWQRPPKVVHNYPTITQDDWEKFIDYRRTPEFKRLSKQGSKIRKKSKYGSIRGQDGYRKRDQAHKTGKYAGWHERWLDMRVKLDGQFKKEEFKTIAETIEEFSQQETQGSFKSVGTKDILTKALGNAEHSGRIRGQSKFVKQSQYFNLVPSSRENDEVSDMKRQLAALERTVQELYAKHGINRETMDKETTAPTVDQHNSFKASCTINEKEAGPSDPKPMPNASKECQLFIPDLVNGGDVLVAIGRAYMDCVPTDTVHGIPLGEENVRVTITVPKLNRALLPIPTNEATTIKEAVGGFVAWPKSSVIVQTSLIQASKGPSRAPDREAEGSKRTKKRAGRKKIQSQPEVEQQPAQQELPSFNFNDISFELRPLAYYAQSSMRDEISANSIMVYISYLVECCARTGMDQRFEFISPVLVSPVQQNVDRATYVREMADYIVWILRNAPKGKRFLMPYNSGQHWILTVIDPWDDLVMYFNPLGNQPGDDFKDLITA